MTTDNMPADIDYKKAYEEQLLLTQEQEELREEYAGKIELLKHELAQLKKLIFLQKRERFVSTSVPEGAPTLFDPPVIEEISPEQVQDVSYTRVVKKKREKRPGRNSFPESLRREEIVIDPSGLDLAFARRIGEDATEILAYQPAEFWVKRVIRTKYLELATGIIHQEKAPGRGFERSKVDVSIPAQLIVSKYTDHTPLDRQIKIFSRLGLTLSDSSINNWLNAAGYFLMPLYEKHKELVLNSNYLHADETTIRVMDSEKKGVTHLGYYWGYQSHEDKLVLFEYQRGRGKDGPREMLKYFKGYLQTDGYQVYEEFGRREGIVLIHCMAHARRKFSEALPNDKVRAEYALTQIQKLYAIERYIDEQSMTAETKLSYRQEHARPVLKSLYLWMQQAIQEVLPASLIGKALVYSLQRWERLSLYAESPQLHVDNNPIENSIRPIALGRKNYLFAGNDKAAQRAAMFYSLLATCKNHNVNPYDWLKDVLARVNDYPMKKIEDLLPQNWKPSNS
jgi:transposase